MDKEKGSSRFEFEEKKNCTLNKSLVFPTEFPYEFDSLDSALSSPVDSVLGSTETETTISSDEEDFLAGLTQRLTHSSTRKLEKSWVVAGSPESTLSGLGSMSGSSNGSPNGSSSVVSSPPTTPFGGQNDTWDLISAAASEIARLKKNTTSNESVTAPNYTTTTTTNSHAHARGLLPPSKSPVPVNVMENPNFGFYMNQNATSNTNQLQLYVKQEQMLKAQSQRQQMMRPQPQQQQIQNKARNFGYENVSGLPLLPQSAWPPLHQRKPHEQQQRSVFVAGSGCFKRECAGTGVFLPRSYSPPDSHKRPGTSNVLIPATAMNGGHVQPRFNSCSFGPNYGALALEAGTTSGVTKKISKS